MGAFADYDLLSADTFELTDGTGATVGTYEVATHPTDDTITLQTSIGAAANGQTDIEGTLRNDQVALPSDFDMQGLSAASFTPGLLGDIRFTSEQGMLNLRSYPTIGTMVGFWALLRYVRGLAGGQATPRLELWPATDSSDEEIILFYRGGWKEPTTDDEVLSPPSWMNLLFIEVFKAVVMGHEESETGTLDQRLTALRKGVLFADARARDLLEQVEIGAPDHTWLDDRGYVSRYDVPPQIIVP